MAGVPAVSEAMVVSVLPTLTGGAPLISATHRSNGRGAILPGPLGEPGNALSDPRPVGSYPFQKDANTARICVIRAMTGRDRRGIARTCKVFHDRSGAALSRHRPHVPRRAKSGTETGWTLRDGPGGASAVLSRYDGRAIADAGQAEAANAGRWTSAHFS